MEHSIQTVKDRFNSGEPLEYVFFWGHHVKPGKMTKACFSNGFLPILWWTMWHTTAPNSI